MTDNVDAPIIDDFGDDPSSGTRGGNWGFSRLRSSITKQTMSAKVANNGDKPPLIVADGTEAQSASRSRKRYWKDISSIRDSIKSLADTISDQYKDSRNIGSKNRTAYDSRRKWFVAQRFQFKLLERLSGIEKSMKRRNGGGLGMLGLLGSMGALGALVKKFTGGGVGGASAGGLATKGLAGLLAVLLAKSAVGKGASLLGGLLKNMFTSSLGVGKRAAIGAGGKALTFGQKAMGSVGTVLKAGKAKLLTGLLPSLGLGGLASALGGVGTADGSAALSTSLRAVLPKILGRIGMAVFGVPGAVAMTAKLVWDHLLPTKWKQYITYKVAKFYLAAIEKVSQLFEWVGNKFNEIKELVQIKLATIMARIWSTMDFVSDLITGEGDARSRVKKYFTSIWATLENTIATYISGFLATFREAYRSFVAPFYDSKGNFSLIRGLKYYVSAGIDFGKDIINKADQAVDTAIAEGKKAIQGIIDSNWNPMNWQKNAEAYTAKYEADQAAQAKRDAETTATVKDGNNVMTNVDKGIQSSNKLLKELLIAMQNSGVNIGNALSAFGDSTNPTNGFTSSGGGNLGDMIGNAESKGNYNAFNRGKAGDSRGQSLNLTGMTIAQVMAMQRSKQLFAAGKYQITPDPLAEAVRVLRLNPNSKFDAAMQDYIFQNYLMDKKRPVVSGYITGKHNNVAEAQLGVAREFAVAANPYTGRGVYDGDKAGNKSTISSATSRTELMRARSTYQAARANGMTHEQAWNEVFKSKGGAISPEVASATTTGTVNSDASVASAAPATAAVATGVFGDPAQLRAQLESAKRNYEMLTGNQGKNSTNLTYAQIEHDLASYKGGVSSIQGQIDDNIRNPGGYNSIDQGMDGEINTVKETVQHKTAKERVMTPSYTNGASAADIFNRPNKANVIHENAFPS